MKAFVIAVRFIEEVILEIERNSQSRPGYWVCDFFNPLR